MSVPRTKVLVRIVESRCCRTKSEVLLDLPSPTLKVRSPHEAAAHWPHSAVATKGLEALLSFESLKMWEAGIDAILFDSCLYYGRVFLLSLCF